MKINLFLDKEFETFVETWIVFRKPRHNLPELDGMNKKERSIKHMAPWTLPEVRWQAIWQW